MKLNKYDKNPILTAKGDSWEGLCVLNPAVIYDEDSKEFKMLYRAAGNDPTHYIYLGLATSKDGYHFDRASDKPVLAPDVNGPDGGCVEDPRLVKMGEYYYLTCHREENTNRDEDLQEIFKAMEQLEFPVIYPVHPRNQARALRLARKMLLTHVILAKPVGYLESACMVKNAQLVITDSGGLQREAFFAGKKCVTLLDFVVWPETMVGNRNVLARPKAEDILEKIAILQEVSADYHPFGDGHAADKIVQAIEAAGK